MDRKIQSTLNLLLSLLDSTLSLSHVVFISELTDEQALEVMDKLVQTYEILLDAMLSGAVLSDELKTPFSDMYLLCIEALGRLSADEDLQENIRERISQIISRLDSVGDSGEGQCVNKPFC